MPPTHLEQGTGSASKALCWALHFCSGKSAWRPTPLASQCHSEPDTDAPGPGHGGVRKIGQREILALPRGRRTVPAVPSRAVPGIHCAPTRSSASRLAWRLSRTRPRPWCVCARVCVSGQRCRLFRSRRGSSLGRPEVSVRVLPAPPRAAGCEGAGRAEGRPPRSGARRGGSAVRPLRT